jgi:hypothetical protein
MDEVRLAMQAVGPGWTDTLYAVCMARATLAIRLIVVVTDRAISHALPTNDQLVFGLFFIKKKKLLAVISGL